MEIIVNGETLPKEVYEHEVQNIKQQNPGIPDEIASEQVKQRLIEWTLIRQAAQEKDLPVWGGEIDAEFEKLCQQHGGKEAFFKRFGMTGSDEGRVKKDIETNLKTQRFLDFVAKDVAEPTDEAVHAHYEANRDKFIKPEQVHVMHIVKQPKDEHSAEVAALQLREVRQKLLAGADFLDTAAKASDCKDQPADLGPIMKGQMAPAFEFIVFSMNVGEISPVFQTQFGLHIATVLSKKPASQMELSECSADIKGHLLQGQKNEVIAAWVNDHKAAATIVVNND